MKSLKLWEPRSPLGLITQQGCALLKAITSEIPSTGTRTLRRALHEPSRGPRPPSLSETPFAGWRHL